MLTLQNRQRVWHWFKNTPVPETSSLVYASTVHQQVCECRIQLMAQSHLDFVAHRTDTPGTTQNWGVPNLGPGGNYTYHLTGHYKALYMWSATAVMSPHTCRKLIAHEQPIIMQPPQHKITNSSVPPNRPLLITLPSLLPYSLPCH